MQLASPVLVFLSFLLTLTTSSNIFHLPRHRSLDLEERASSSSTTENTATTCELYATVANLSTIGLNSTFRAAFLQSSPQGTDTSVGILNNAEKQITTMVGDEELNTRCGNATAVAAVEAPKNFSMGIVGPFTLAAVNGAVRNGGLLGMGLLVVLVSGGVVLV